MKTVLLARATCFIGRHRKTQGIYLHRVEPVDSNETVRGPRAVGPEEFRALSSDATGRQCDAIPDHTVLTQVNPPVAARDDPAFAISCPIDWT
jgi:hypothetical protein